MIVFYIPQKTNRAYYICLSLHFQTSTMASRRTFLQQTATTAFGAWALNHLPAADLLKKKRKLGVQLFTFFPSFEQDVPGNLKKIADTGIVDIESAYSLKGGFYGMGAKEFRKMVEDLGMKWRSQHVLGAPLKPNPQFDVSKMPKFNTLKNESQQIVDSMAESGVKYLVCANYPHDTLDEWKEGLAVLQKQANRPKKRAWCSHITTTPVNLKPWTA
jgi:hypothetical protein